MESFISIPKTFENTVLETIYKRRAIRKFHALSVSEDQIEKILNAGRMAPSAINKQPWHFYVITDSVLIQKLSRAIMSSSKMAMFKAGIKEVAHAITNPASFHIKEGLDFFKSNDPVFHGAPLVIYITSPKNNEWAPLDIGMCAQNMMLAAESLGLKSCPIGFGKYIEKTEDVALFNLPESHQINLALIFGYSEEVPEIHPRNKDNATRLKMPL